MKNCSTDVEMRVKSHSYSQSRRGWGCQCGCGLAIQYGCGLVRGPPMNRDIYNLMTYENRKRPPA